MDALIAVQSFLLETLVPFIILLGLLIFVHELGHFAVAKWCKVRVEVFSLGFGKKVLHFVHGHTTYCIAMIPLGGYVKMFGDDPNADIPEEDKKESFLHKPVSQRIAIVLAGPLMNFFFAILLFALVGLNGDKELSSTLGDIPSSSQAWKDGFRSGDKIKSINGAAVSTWDDVKRKLKDKSDQSLLFLVDRDGSEVKVSSIPKLKENPDVLAWQEMVGQIGGLTPFSKASHIGLIHNSIAYQAGLRTLDQIVEVNSKKVKSWRNLELLFSSLSSDKEILLKVKRYHSKDNIETLDIAIPAARLIEVQAISLNSLGILPSELFIFRAVEDMPAMKAGIQKGDKILSINEKTISKWEDVLSTVSGYTGSKPLRFSVLRKGEEKKLKLTPKKNSFIDGQGQEITRFQVGVQPAIFQTADPFVFQTSGFLETVSYGWNKTLHWTEFTILSFVRMLQSKISSKNIGGIFTIGQVASETFKLGLSPYLRIMAIISINLFILNLLPIPVLDGGHLLFFTLEALKGSPVSLRKIEVAQQIGLFILMGLMAFAIFNDITRIW